MNKVDILIISNRFDFTTDYVCLELKKRKCKYLRLNRDEFSSYKISLDIFNSNLSILFNDELYVVDQKHLKSIYYRAPIYLRDIYKPNIPKEEQLYRTQWTAFIRNLTFFENVTWLNNPISTFKAENKVIQLKYAKKLGFHCPETIITNNEKFNINPSNSYILKSLDTGVLRIDDKEAFIYSNVVRGQDILDSNLSLSPVILQEYLYPKIDIRVTIIGNKIYAVKIMKHNQGIDGDWRKEKNDVDFIPLILPSDIHLKCIQIVKSLGLAFGAIDLIYSEGIYYFIELNPTGEWAWLVDSANQNIHLGICDYLEGLENG